MSNHGTHSHRFERHSSRVLALYIKCSFCTFLMQGAFLFFNVVSRFVKSSTEICVDNVS